MKHYILTRFNLGLYTTNPHKIADPDQWMQHRIALFRKYTLPSLQDQTCQDYTWLLGFDPETPNKYLEPFQIAGIKICYERPDFWLKQQTAKDDWLITSRLDNDDILLPDFVIEIQKAFRSQREVIDVDYIARDLKTGIDYTSNRFKANGPFLSLCEPWENITTALGRPHSEMPNYYEARRLSGYHAIQLIHDRNLMNKIQGVKI